MATIGDRKVEVCWPNDGTTWTDITADCDSCSITRGRSRETDTVNPGNLTLSLDNTNGNYTPNRAASAYYPNVKLNRPIRVSVYNGTGQTYIFTGTIDAITAGWDGGRKPIVNITATDGFKGLNRRTSQTFYTETVLDNTGFPSFGYYPLSEPVGATSFGSANPNAAGAVAILTTSKYGAGTFTAGNGQGFLAGAPNATYCTFAFTGTGNTEHMTVVQVSGAAGQSGTPLPAGGNWTWGCWFEIPTAPTDRATLLFAKAFSVDPALPAAPRSAHLYMDSAGKINFAVSAGGTTTTVTSASGYAGSTWHYVTASLSSDLKTLSLFVDSSGATAVAGSAVTTLGALNWVVAGGAYSPFGDSAYGLNGSLANLKFYTGVDTALGNGIRWLFGQRMYYLGSDTGSIITNIAQNFGYKTLAAPFVVADTGVTAAVYPFEMNGLSYLNAMQQVSDTEQGLLYVDGAGSLIAKNRAYRVNQASAFSLDASRQDIGVDFEVGVDDQMLLNDYAATRPGGAVIRVRDTTTTSIADNGVYTNAGQDASAELILVTTDNEVRDFASFKVAQYSQPQPRTPQITVDLKRAPDLWSSVIGTDLGIRFTVINLPAEAPASTMDYITESMRWDFSGRSDTCMLTLDTSPADLQKYFTLDDNTYGLLDNNVLFY